MITSLQNNATMLSVGSGEAHLERLLTNGFNIPTKTIITPNLSPRKSKLDQKYINNLLGTSLNEKQFKHYLERMGFGYQKKTVLIPGNHNPKDRDFFMQVVNMDVPKVHQIYNILKQAIPNLNPNGEIRIKHGIHESQQRAYIIAKLAQEYQTITFPHKTGSYENFFVKLQ